MAPNPNLAPSRFIGKTIIDADKGMATFSQSIQSDKELLREFTQNPNNKKAEIIDDKDDKMESTEKTIIQGNRVG